MSARKIRQSWWVDFRFGFQRYRIRSPENSKAGTQAYEATLRKMLAAGERIDEGEKKLVKFQDFAADWFRVYVMNNNKLSVQLTQRGILDLHLLPYFGKYRLSEITSQAVERYKAKKASEGLAPKSINNQLGVLRRCLQIAMEWGSLDKLPTIKMLKTPPPVVVFLNENECRALLADKVEPLANLMILTALRTGMRLGELCGLSWEDIDFKSGIVTVRHSFVRGEMNSPKSNKIRHIPITADLTEALKKSAKPCGLVFQVDKKPITGYAGSEILGRACIRANIKHIGWHKLRHTFASQLVARGANLRAVQELLGHSTIQMTERYVHLAPSSLRQAMSVLEDSPRVENLGNPWATAFIQHVRDETLPKLKMTMNVGK